MMECIIILPLHLLALLGTVYLGTLGSDRNAVLSMEHFAAFVSKTTLAGAADSLAEMKNFYYPEDTYISLKQKPVVPQGGTDSYLYLSKARVDATRSLPVWLEGIRTVSRVVLGLTDDQNKLLQDWSMSSSSVPEGNSAFLLKNPSYSRIRSESNLWAEIAAEPFMYGPAPDPVTASEVSEYNRNSDCVTWSVPLL